MERFDLDLLLSVAGGLGRWQEFGNRRVYAKDDDCIACLRDLQRFLRRDDPRDRPAFMKLGELQVVQNDVIPLITNNPTDTDLVYNALKVMTFMTMPLDLGIISDLLPKQLLLLSSIKESCLSRDLLGALMALAAGPLSRAEKMSDEDHQVLQLLLTFFRNLVSIPDRPLTGSAAEKGQHTPQVKAQEERTATDAAAAAAADSQQQVIAGDPASLATLEIPETDLAPGLPTLNLTKLTPIIPLLAGLNATVLVSWVDVVERTPSESLALVVPALNNLNASTLEAFVAALPYLNWETILAILPLVNELPASTLTSYINLLQDIDPKWLERLLPGIVALDPDWVNKVVPAVIRAFDPDYLVRLVNAIAPGLSRVNPDLLVALLPLVNTISLETWAKLIELLNMITIPQLEFLLHLLDVTGPILDKMVRILNTMRRMIPIDKTNYMGKITVFTKPKGTIGLQDSSVILGRKIHPQSPPNNGAPPAPIPPPVPALPRTLNSSANATAAAPAAAPAASSSSGRHLLNAWHLWW